MKTSELTGAALDWAVAKCEGYFDIDMAVVRNGVVRVHYFDKWAPTADWSQGGPIIEREGISTAKDGDGHWRAGEYLKTLHHYGSTPLIAAMRCFVASKLGDEVNIPAELID